MRLTKAGFIPVILLLIWSTSSLAARGTIKGRITDRTSGQPLMGANVLVTSPALPEPTGAATDLNGGYEVRNLPTGTYTVKATYMGYEEEAITVELPQDGVEVVNIALNPAAIEMEEIIVETASRRRERIEDAPAAISVITQRNIRRESNTNLGDYLKGVKGVEFTQSGVDSYNLSARGFNSSFSSRFLTLTDGRMANVPSLRLIAYNVIPVTFEDVQQIEVVLGPSSATYGPNAHSGVLNIITQSPRFADPLTVNLQASADARNLRKITARGSYTRGQFGAKLSTAYFTAREWRHFNEEEWEGHHFALVGNWDFTMDGENAVWQTGVTESGSPTKAVKIPDPWPDSDRGLTDTFLDSEGIESFFQDGQYYTYVAFADGIDNDRNSDEENPIITQQMTVGEIPGNGMDDNNNGLIDENDWVGYPYADGTDNDNDGLIDEGVDTGIDDFGEKWFDGIDNDGDGEIDEPDERGTKWVNRVGEYGQNKFGEYIFDQDGNILFDTNKDGVFGGKEDSTIHSYRVYDSNGDGLKDFPDFDVRNLRADFRMDYDPREDVKMSFAYGYARAKNINITGIARYLADGWTYRYAHGRLTYKNWFAQAYLNMSFAGKTRSLATGDRIKDTSKKFSAQIQHHRLFWNDRQRIVWGIDYFRTMPQTFGTILGDDHLWDNIDNDGDGEDGSPVAWAETVLDNGEYDPGEPYKDWDELDGKDNARGAIADGIDNDGDGLTDEGIDEKDEDNRYLTNELGFYFQSNTKLTDKLELILAGRLDAHEQLTGMIDFGSENREANPFKWGIDFSKTAGLQISPKIGLQYKPADHQNFRLTWAKAYNTPSSQALFLDIFVTRLSIFKIYAKGAANGYAYPRDENGDLTFWDISGDMFQFNSISMEDFNDEDGDGAWSFEDGSIDTVTDIYGNEYVYEFDSNGEFDFSDYGSDGKPAEPYTDENGNGQWDFGEDYDDLDGNRFYSGPDLNGTEGDGVFQEGEPAERHEVWTDANGNGDWDGLYKLLFPNLQKERKGIFKTDISVDPKPIEAEIVRTLEFGWKGRLAIPLYATLDIFYSKYDSFVSPILLITPLVVENDPDLTIDDFFDCPSCHLKGVVVSGDTTQLIEGQNPPVVVGYLNYGKVRMWGLDASFTYFFNKDLALDGNYSFLSLSDFINPLTGTKDPINAPRNKWALKATYESPIGVSVAASLRHVDSFEWQSGIYFGTIRAYSILDLHLSYSFNDHLKLFATINNVLEDRHTEIIGGPKLGRMTVLRLQGRL
ncbi:MAG: TonB-dependent receptor [Candidatus Neomarinimicrobiota bacterium]